MIELHNIKCKYCKRIIENNKEAEQIGSHLDCLKAMKEFNKNRFGLEHSSIKKEGIQYRPVNRGPPGGYMERLIEVLNRDIRTLNNE